MTTGPKHAQGAVDDTSADVPDERDVRETWNEQDAPEDVDENTPEYIHAYTPETVDENTPEVVRENAPEAFVHEDAGDQEYTTAPGETPGAAQLPPQPGGIPSTAAGTSELGNGSVPGGPGTSTAGTIERDTGTTATGTMGSNEADADVSGPLLTQTESSRSSWPDILAGFVDDPRGSVAQAATMVEETAETLVATIQERERVLRGAWEGNGGAAGDTERLRIALGEYRTFFEKITRL